MQPVVILLAGAPAVVLGLMAALGWANGWAALAAAIVLGLLSFCITLVLKHDAEALSEAVREALVGGQAAPEPATTLFEQLRRDIGRLARESADRVTLAEQHRRADTLILERLPDPLIVLAEDMTIRRRNRAARTDFQDDLAAVLRRPALREAVERALRDGTAQTAEVSLSAAIRREVVASVVPIDPPLADGGRAVIILSDRTRERAVERMRADFVANVSHELRTPLTALVGFTETLRGPAADDPPAQQRFLAIMADQAGRMSRLIDDLLSLSRIELNEHQPPSEPLDLAGVIARHVASLEPALERRASKLDVRVADDLPALAGDADQMSQVLQNLLDNAMKYGKPGGTVTVALTRAMPGEQWPKGQGPVGQGPGGQWPARPGVVLAVSDQGAGIAPEHLPRLTERFYRVDKARSRAVGGTGLGLAIVKHIVNRHRGQLAIASEVDKGTTIAVWLPAVTEPATDG